MSNIEKLDSIFCETFGIESSVLGPECNSKSVEGWDSVRQLSLTVALEEAFDIFMDPEDIIACDSYEGVKAVLAKYDVAL